MKIMGRIAAGIVRIVINAENGPWPPVCIGVFYQPERPKTPQKQKKLSLRMTNK